MSVKINNMANTDFLPFVGSGTAPLVSDNSTLGATTAFIKLFITTYLIPLANTLTITAINLLTFNDARLTVLKGDATTFNIRGNVTLGQSTTTIKAFDTGSGGITFPMNTDYPYILSSSNTNSQRIQAGYITGASTSFSVNTPKLPSGTANAFATPSVSLTSGTANPNGGFGFNIRSSATTSNVYYWILFQTNA